LSSLYILKEEGPDVPKFYLKSTIDHRTILKSLEENGKLKEAREKYLWPDTEFKSMKFKNDEGIEYSINTMIQKPVNFISWKKYNLIIFVYGGPGSQLVMKKYNSINTGFTTFLTSKNCVVVTIDTRGTKMRGERFMKQVYKNLGYLETQDVINVAKEMKKENWVNKVIGKFLKIKFTKSMDGVMEVTFH
jgi:dipeptidyl-peptidase 4